MLDLLPVIDQMAEQVAPLRCPDQIPSDGAPLMERWAQTHDATTERLFSA
jgi:urease accessory protein